jgi:glyoxylase-like metal-dependent hydrolase (beta-lactamase superfamily II)
MADVAIASVDHGWFVRPGEETADGVPRVVPLVGYVVRHPRGVLLLDTGIGTHPETDAHYRPRRHGIEAALSGVGLRVDDVDVVVNCHLHFDHCGGNPAFTTAPVVVQAVELGAARGADYTLPGLVDAPGVRYDVVDGDAEIWPGVSVVPTPGHTAGHQSVVVRDGSGTVTVLAGQSHETASDFAADALALAAAGDPGRDAGPLPVPAAWVSRLLALDPRVVRFAHDEAVWVPR